MLDGGGNASRQLVDFANSALDLGAAVVGALVGLLDLLGGGIGVLGYILHAVGDLVNGSSHQLHALGLSRHVTQAVIADLVQLVAGADQLAGAVAELLDDVAQVAVETVEVVRNLRQLIACVIIKASRQVCLAAGHVAHGADHLVQWLRNAAANDEQQQEHGQDNHGAKHDRADHRRAELGLHGINVDTCAHHVIPGLEEFEGGDLGRAVLFARLGPGVLEAGRALGARQLDHLGNDVHAFGVAHGGQVSANGLWRQRMHDHDVIHVIDPVVLIAAVAQGGEGAEGFLAGLFAGQLAIQLLLVIEGHQVMGDLHQMGCLGDFGFSDFLVQVRERQAFCGQGTDQCNNQDQPDPLADSNVAQQLHVQPPPAECDISCYVSGCHRAAWDVLAWCACPVCRLMLSKPERYFPVTRDGDLTSSAQGLQVTIGFCDLFS